MDMIRGRVSHFRVFVCEGPFRVEGLIYASCVVGYVSEEVECVERSL